MGSFYTYLADKDNDAESNTPKLILIVFPLLKLISRYSILKKMFGIWNPF